MKTVAPFESMEKIMCLDLALRFLVLFPVQEVRGRCWYMTYMIKMLVKKCLGRFLERPSIGSINLSSE